MNTNNTHCWLSCLGFFILWWLIASALLKLTWNHVIGTVAKVKAVKFWHAAILLFTVTFVCVIPKMCMHRYGMRGSCGYHCGKGDCAKGDCDYHGKKGDKDDQD